MKKVPFISVIMPVFNAEKYVAESVQSALAQTFSYMEVICIDDGSTDASLDILRSFGTGIHVLQNLENHGPAQARNRGLEIARGDFVAFIDADDIWEKDKLERQASAFEKDSTLSMCFAHMQCFLSPELPDAVKKLRYCPTNPMPGYVAGTSVIKRSVFDTVGTFDEMLRVGEFIDWYTRAEDAGYASSMLPAVLLHRRIHETNTGVSERDSRKDYLKIARSVLERRRAID